VLHHLAGCPSGLLSSTIPRISLQNFVKSHSTLVLNCGIIHHCKKSLHLFADISATNSKNTLTDR